MRQDRRVLVPQKIAGEGGGGDDIRPGVVQDHVGKIGDALPHQPFAYGEGDRPRLLAEQEEVQRVVFRRRALDQTAVAQREGVGVHHDGGAFPLPPGLFQALEITGKAVAPVFHEDQLALDAGDLVKAQVAEDPVVLRLGVEENMAVAALRLLFQQMAHHLVHQALAPVGRGHGQAAQRVLEAAARGDERAVLVEDAAAVIQVFVPADALGAQQLVHLRLRALVPRGDLSD